MAQLLDPALPFLLSQNDQPFWGIRRIADFFDAKLANHLPAEHVRGLSRYIVDVAVLGGESYRCSRQVVEGVVDEFEEITLAVRLHASYLTLTLQPCLSSVCTECLDLRMASMLMAVEQKVIGEGVKVQRAAGSAFVTAFSLELIWSVFEVSLLQGRNAAGIDRGLMTFDLAANTSRRYALLPDALCSLCSVRSTDSKEDISFELRKNLFPRNGRTRLRSVREYPIDERQFVNPVCGVVSKTVGRDLTHALTAPVVGGFLDPADPQRLIDWGGHTLCYKDSFLVGVLEGLERQAGLNCRAKEAIVLDSYRNLGDDALDPASCGLYEPECYSTDSKLVEYTPDLKFKWVWGYSVTSRRPILVPRQMAYYGVLESGEQRFVEHSSSGCAIGSCLEEAVLRALLELIERDSFMLSWYSDAVLGRIDPRSCEDQLIRHVVNKIDRLNWDIFLLDGRLDVRIPTVISVARRRDRKLGSLLLAAGCSVDPQEAIRTSLMEVASYVMGFHEAIKAKEAQVRHLTEDFGRVRDINEHTLLYGLPEMADRIAPFYSRGAKRSFEETYLDQPRLREGETISGHLQNCIAELSASGMQEVIVVDQTPREQQALGTKTVCVIVPGLVPMDFGYDRRRVLSLSRLRTAPLKAGVLTRPEDGISLLPHPFP